MGTVFFPRRGRANEIPEKLKPHELFYVTDLQMMGVANDVGDPQLLVEVLAFATRNDFPDVGAHHKIYRDVSKGTTYHYDGKKYNEIFIHALVKGNLKELKFKIPQE
jgi:hypothetical protein